MTVRGWLLFALLCLLWGIPYLLIKVAVREVSPAMVVFLRTAIGALLLVPLAASRGQLRMALPKWPAVLAFTAAEMGGPWLLLSNAERTLPSSLTSLFVAAVPTVAALLVAATGQERLDARRAAGLALGFAGVAAMVGLGWRGPNALGFVQMGVVVIGYAIAPIILSRQLSDLPGLGVMALALSFCAVGYAPVALLSLPHRLPDPATLGAIAVLGVACTGAAFLAFYALIAEAGPVRAVLITYVNPAVALLLGVGLLGERFTPALAIWFALILAGAVVATRPARDAGVRTAL